MKKLVTSLSPLSPFRITNIDTGEILAPLALQEALGSLIAYCHDQTSGLYVDNREELLEIVKDYRSNANAFGRKHGYASEYKYLPREILAKSRINELILFKLISETSAYVKNPNKNKREHSFGHFINLGAVDKQMASLAHYPEERVLTLVFKCWDLNLLLEFSVPAYVQKYNIKKWSLPVVKKHDGQYAFIFSIQENIPERPKGKHVAGLDLGLVEPYIMAVTNKRGERVAHYSASKGLRRLTVKRGRLLGEASKLSEKIRTYDKLGLDSTVLAKNKKLVNNKATRLAKATADKMASEITRKLDKHWINVLHVEDLTWVSGQSESRIGSSRWTHSMQRQKIAHTALRRGLEVKEISPRNSSNFCHKCGTFLLERGRGVWCNSCKTKLDRDFNAAMNMASMNHLKNQENRPPASRATGSICSQKQDVTASFEKPSARVLGNTETRFPT